LVTTIFNLVAGKRLLYRPFTGTTETVSLGIARYRPRDKTATQQPPEKNFAKSCAKNLFKLTNATHGTPNARASMAIVEGEPDSSSPITIVEADLSLPEQQEAVLAMVDA
jgi:hypothetical protein